MYYFCSLIYLLLFLFFFIIQSRIIGPSQFPQVDKPHPASIAGSRLAVVGSARKDVAQGDMQWFLYRRRGQQGVSKDTLNGDYIENGFAAVKLVTIREPTHFNHPEAHKYIV
jgi:hypothetical protein